jgi:hypothetical protein
VIQIEDASFKRHEECGENRHGNESPGKSYQRVGPLFTGDTEAEDRGFEAQRPEECGKTKNGKEDEAPINKAMEWLICEEGEAIADGF